MYKLHRPDQLQRSIRTAHHGTVVTKGKPLTHTERVIQELKVLGVSKAALGSMEGRYLPKIIHDDEHLGGIVYGHHKDGFAMLIATDQRVIFLDKKPLFVNEDEISYDVVSGVKHSRTTFGVTVTLHTRIRDYELQSINEQCAHGFVAYIETHGLEREAHHDSTQ